MKPSDASYTDHGGLDDVPGSLPAPVRVDIEPGKQTTPAKRSHLSALQVKAWSVANVGYGIEDGKPYRALAVDLYRQDMHERITSLFDALDRQNVEIDIALTAATGRRHLAPSSSLEERTSCDRLNCVLPVPNDPPEFHGGHAAGLLCAFYRS